MDRLDTDLIIADASGGGGLKALHPSLPVYHVLVCHLGKKLRSD
jgi:hypothetical protein